jgi:hypothetical protein
MGRKKVHFYWTDEVDVGIKLYLSTTDPLERNKIYKQYLQAPFEKMCEFIINRWGFDYFERFWIPLEDKKHDCVGFMLSKIHLFNPDKGRSFSYFSLVVKHYLIQVNNKNYEIIKRTDIYPTGDTQYRGGGAVNRLKRITLEYESSQLSKEVYDSYLDFLERNKDQLFHMGMRFKKGGNNNKVLKVFLEILKDSGNTFHYKHKELYSIMKEKAGLRNMKPVGQTMKVLKNLYQKVKTQIINTGELNPKWERMVQWNPKK